MTEADFETLLEACKPTVCIKIGSYEGSSPQENANRAWANLGEKMGFDSMTVEPRHEMGMRFFSAIPNETPEAKAEREGRERSEARLLKIKALESEILQKQEQLAEVRRGTLEP